MSTTPAAFSELGVSSAPLKSAAFFLGAQCGDVNDDFMLCKNIMGDPTKCLLEGRRVTRCAIDLFSKINAKCLEEFNAHWECLDNANHTYYACRTQERVFNQCVLANLGLKKVVPGGPKGEVPIHEKVNQMYKYA